MKKLAASIAVALLTSGFLSNAALSATFTIDSSQSFLDATGSSFFDVPVEEQLPGSLVAPIQGSLEAIVLPGSIEFPGGSVLDLIAQAGPFLPGNAPADIAGETEAPGVIRNLVLDVAGGPTALVGGNFNADTSLDVLSGLYEDNVGPVDLTPFTWTNSPTAMGTYGQVGNVFQIVLPIDISFNLVFDSDAMFDSDGKHDDPDEPLKFRFTGQIVATRPVPEPAAATSAWIGVMTGVAAVVIRHMRRRARRGL